MKFTEWAWEQKLPATEKLVLLALARHTNNGSGLCWPSTATLGDLTGLHNQTVSRAITRLRKRRLISRERRFNNSSILLLHTENQSNPSNNIININTKIDIDRDS